jgi:biopolymer transport protein ExbD
MAKIHRVRPPEEIPDSAMADVAFLLLIFFLATTTIAEEFGLSLILPAKSQRNEAIQVNRDNVMVISTDPSGNIFYVDDDPVPLAQIKALVETRKAGNDKLVVSVEPDRRAPYRAMVDILDEVKQAKATRISLKTRRQ